MMKCEFENLIGQSISQEDYSVVENCYMYLDTLFPDKASVADAYMKNGILFFRKLNTEVNVKKLVEYEAKIASDATKKQVQELRHSSQAIGVCVDALRDLNLNFESEKLENLVNILLSSQKEINVAVNELRKLYEIESLYTK